MKDKLPWYPKIPPGMPFFLKGYAHEVLARSFFVFFLTKASVTFIGKDLDEFP